MTKILDCAGLYDYLPAYRQIRLEYDMNNALTRFLGDQPTRVAIKLVVFSVIAGVVMSTIGWSPRTILDGIVRFFSRIWELGFEAIYNSFEYFFLGAAVVVPAFFLIRLLNYRSSKS